MFENANLPRVVKVKSTTPIHDDIEVFDMMSRFLASEKAKQLSHDFAGQAYLASSSQIWNDLRQACNSLLEKNDPRREPVAAWKEQLEEISNQAVMASPIKSESLSVKTTESETDDVVVEGSEEKTLKTKKRKRKSDVSEEDHDHDDDVEDDDDDDDKDDDHNGDESSRKRRKAEKKAKKQAKKEKKQAKKEKKEKKAAKKSKLVA